MSYFVSSYLSVPHELIGILCQLLAEIWRRCKYLSLFANHQLKFLHFIFQWHYQSDIIKCVFLFCIVGWNQTLGANWYCDRIKIEVSYHQNTHLYIGKYQAHKWNYAHEKRQTLQTCTLLSLDWCVRLARALLYVQKVY